MTANEARAAIRRTWNRFCMWLLAGVVIAAAGIYFKVDIVTAIGIAIWLKGPFTYGIETHPYRCRLLKEPPPSRFEI